MKKKNNQINLNKSTIKNNKLLVNKSLYKNNGTLKTFKEQLQENILKILPKAISNPLNVVESTTDPNSIVIITELADNNDNIVVVSLKLNGKGQIEIDNANRNINANVMTSAYGRKNYDRQKKPISGSYIGWMQENFEKERIIYDIDEGIKKRLTNGQWLQLPNPDNKSTTKTNGSVINNSITQKASNVKSNTAINNKSMQNTENNTNNDEVRSLKNNKLAKQGNIMYNSDGIKLSKKEYANVMSIINTNKINSGNMDSVFCSNYFYVYRNNGFDNNTIIAKMKIEGNEDIINIVRKEIKNGTIKKSKTFDRVMQNIRNERKSNNSNNVSSKRASKNKQIIRLGSRNGQSEPETRQRQIGNTSFRNQSRISNNDSTWAIK